MQPNGRKHRSDVLKLLQGCQQGCNDPVTSFNANSIFYI